jgi:hypothetical protein
MKKIYIALKYTGQRELSFNIANKAILDVITSGHIPISTISMTHMASKKYNLPPEADFWWGLNKTLLDACDEVWVFHNNQLPYENSVGVRQEIEYAKSKNMPVHFINIKDVLV